ncbi:MAG: hypothetical protein H7061_08140 [Bdellovibrionaceae bacterium]|nr:hypothetical protein [Bdellovibrio sp.]
MQKANADVCTPVAKPTKYVVKRGDHIAEILRIFKLEPVFGNGGTLEQLLKQNNIPNENSIAEKTELTLPFTCEQQTNGWRILDRGEDRLITGDKLEQKKSKGVDQTSLPGSKDRALEILEGDKASDPLAESTGTDVPNEEMSEALRYRMICDGEWTGTECVTRYSSLYALGGAWYSRYDGTDATTGGEGTLLSKMKPEFGFGWHNYWFENFRTNLGISHQYNEIHPEVRERPIVQDKKLLTSLFIDARFETGPFGFTFGISQAERLFYRFLRENIVLFEDGGVIVNAVPIMIYRGAISYMFYQAGKYRFDAEVGFANLQATSTGAYNVKEGSAADISITVQHDRVKTYLFGTLKYEQSQQDTDILIQRAKEIGVKFGYAWKLKDW